MTPIRWYISMLMLVGASFRFWDLSYASMIADVMEYYKIAQAKVSPWELLKNPTQYGLTGLWAAAHNAFFVFTGLDVTFRNIRLIDAFTGVVTIPALYMLGKRVAGRRVGLAAATFLALHPVHIQMSRESYAYVAIALGVVLMLWTIFELVRLLERKQSPGPAFILLAFAGFALTTMNVSSWPFAGVAGLALYVLLMTATWKKQIPWWPIAVLTVGFIILLIPMLGSGTLDWAFKQLFGAPEEDANAQFWQEIMGEKTLGAFLKESLLFMQSYLFGVGGIRGILNMAVLGLAGWFVFNVWKQDRRMLTLCSVCAGTVMVMCLALYRADQVLAGRLFSPLTPFFALFVGMATVQAIEAAKSKLPQQTWTERVAWSVSILLLMALFLRPAVWSLKTEGYQPYLRIAQWADTHLPKGTVVQCDRWLSPWNELRVNPSTNVTYTFLFPNAPPSVYEESQWRKTLLEYFDRNPFAVYLEQRHYWDRLGPWEEPHDLFARKQVFIDEATLKLNRIGLAYRGHANPDESREFVKHTLFYNTDEDVLARAGRRGHKAVVGFGPSWRYLMPWQPIQGWPEQLMHTLWVQAGLHMNDGRTLNALDDLNRIPQQQAMHFLNRGRWADYHIAPERGPLRVFNLTDQPVTARLSITAIALSGTIRARVGHQTVIFPQTRLTEQVVDVPLQPGENTVVISLPPEQFLLVRAAQVRVVDEREGEQE